MLTWFDALIIAAGVALGFGALFATFTTFGYLWSRITDRLDQERSVSWPETRDKGACGKADSRSESSSTSDTRSPIEPQKCSKWKVGRKP